MICESIKAVIRLVVRPGLINVGLDDLMSALRTNRSRCLFGSGIADGEDRATRALQNALNSPLLDQGALLKDAQTVLVHLSGGEDLTLFEIELLMQGLQKFVPEQAHVLFGAAVDPTMGNSLSITLISALPEDSLSMAPRDSTDHPQAGEIPTRQPSPEFSPKPVFSMEPLIPQREPELEPEPAPASPTIAIASEETLPFAEQEILTEIDEAPPSEPKPVPTSLTAEFFIVPRADDSTEAEPEIEYEEIHEADIEENDQPLEPESPLELEPAAPSFAPGPRNKPPLTAPWGRPIDKDTLTKMPAMEFLAEETDLAEVSTSAPPQDLELPKLKLGIKPSTPQTELSLDSGPRGRFEGETPNVFEGEDLDLPPFLRKKK
jgi:cell division protein FtsZ